jgi:hypothetical protein
MDDYLDELLLESQEPDIDDDEIDDQALDL